MSTNIGDVQGYVFSADQNAYPDGGVSGDYYYDQRTEIQMTLTVPATAMQGQPVNISWSAVDGADGYILERSADSGAWTQVYQGANLSYTDTAGSWTSVQYRVKAGLDGSYGDYKTSASVPVAAASALVISGTDGSLGTLTADVAYSVSSDTGNQISLSVEVNGAEWLNSQVSSGYDGVLPVMELPVGSGSIVIKATVQASAGPVSATRSWTYSKTAISFPAAAQAGVLQQAGQNFLPATLAELVRTNPFWGGNLDKALEKLVEVVTGSVKIATGSYVGTGTYGASNPCSITADFPIKILIVLGYLFSSTERQYVSGFSWLTPIMIAENLSNEFDGSGITVDARSIPSNLSYGMKSADGKTFSWYNPTSAYYQANDTGTTFDYLIIG